MKNNKLLLGLLCFGAAGSLACQSAPATSLKACLLDNDAAAQQGWRPMNGSLPALGRNVNGRPTLEFRCNFESVSLERASWDHALDLNLSDARGISFEVFCQNPTPISYFSVYFQSADGWYSATFFPEDDGWQTINIDKADMSTEGTPGGWSKLKTIRISAWRSRDIATTFQIRGLRATGKLGQDASVAILRGDGNAERWPAQAASFHEIADRVARQLRAADVECAILSDTNISAMQLRQAKLLVLPHNPQLNDTAVSAIKDYASRGGKILAFYSVPSALLPALNLAQGSIVKAASPEAFSKIQFLPGALPGAPLRVEQHSSLINAISPQPGRTRKLADWLDATGKPSGYAAVLASTNCILMTHVFQPSTPADGRQLLLAMAGSLVPDLWQGSIETRMNQMAILGRFKEFSPLSNHLWMATGGKGPAARALAAAAAHREKVSQLLDRKEYAEALAETSLASTNLLEAFCRAQKPLAGEFRGFWCHSAMGVNGMSWDEAISILAKNGFTAIMPNMLWGGAAYYDSKVLPVAPAVARAGDQIKECLAACRKHGVAMHVWKVHYYLGNSAPREFVDGMKREGRLQVSSSGEPHDWLCPSHPANQKLEIDSMVEIARNYAVDGLHFDYIRYPGSDYCFCQGCRERFEQSIGTKVSNWPGDVLAENNLGKKWNAWRRGNITTVVKAISEQARAVRSSIKISAAVFRSWDRDRDTVAQDWKAWCDKGYMDFVCPMDYTPSYGRFENMIERQIEWTGKVPCYPGLGLSASESKFGADRAIEQILITRRHHTGGFMIFNYGQKEAREILPLLGAGITAPITP